MIHIIDRQQLKIGIAEHILMPREASILGVYVEKLGDDDAGSAFLAWANPRDPSGLIERRFIVVYAGTGSFHANRFQALGIVSIFGAPYVVLELLTDEPQPD